MKKITEHPEWQTLVAHQADIAAGTMQAWFTDNPQRFQQFSLQVGELFLDYSKNRVTAQTLQHLIALAHAAGLPQKMEALFNGQPINSTERRPALHTALRDSHAEPLLVNGTDIKPTIQAAHAKMRDISEQIRQGNWRGATGKRIVDIINIGIGGSHLGPLMTTTALSDYAAPELRCHFISDIDSSHLWNTLNRIDPEAALFIISSKSFTTLETMTNARTVRTWLAAKLGREDLSQHFIAVTAAKEKALAFGIAAAQILPLWDWVGGRYSIWSAIGLPLAILIGMPRFLELLAGAEEMDRHFRHAPFAENMPVILGLLGIWYINFFGANNHAISPYANQLHYFRAYLQQADMESNGKSTTHAGSETDYPTGPIIWGELGCDAQHAFNQLIHQSNYLIPVDFILAKSSAASLAEHQHILTASCLSQAQALMQGKSYAALYDELRAEGLDDAEAARLARHKTVPGNRPSNTLFLDTLSPRSLGALIALYEHKIFVQGAIWDINSFDQWGVELGKQLLPKILTDLTGTTTHHQHDASTDGLIQHYKKTGNPA